MAIIEEDPTGLHEIWTKVNTRHTGTIIETTAVDAAEQFYKDSAAFWFSNIDLFSNDGMQSGVVLQYGLTHKNEVVALDDTECQTKPRTLIFQAESPTVFNWKLVEVDDTGRTETLISINPAGSTAASCRYDAQGRQKGQESVEEGELNRIRKSICFTLSSELMADHANSLRTQRARAEASIGEFVVTGAIEYAPKKYEELLEKKKEVLNKLYFSPLSVR
jgi:hypothetical protein